jgi:hypothetical protein
VTDHPAHETENRLSPEENLGAESALLDAMLGAAKEREQATEIVEIAREGKVKFAFRIRPLTEEENEGCDEMATVYKKDRRALAPIPLKTDRAKYRSLVIVKATVAFCEKAGDNYRDVESMWDNGALRRQLGVESKWEMVDRVMLPGEKEKVMERISELSGFGPDMDDAKDQAKN